MTETPDSFLNSTNKLLGGRSLFTGYSNLIGWLWPHLKTYVIYRIKQLCKQLLKIKGHCLKKQSTSYLQLPLNDPNVCQHSRTQQYLFIERVHCINTSFSFSVFCLFFSLSPLHVAALVPSIWLVPTQRVIPSPSPLWCWQCWKRKRAPMRYTINSYNGHSFFLPASEVYFTQSTYEIHYKLL